mmetsp:Transcript_36616/g.117569  ORF Transcript_36616/g.117569 Transcript_36616/m.117569 type:complete len:231 (-) Transcript_36616:1683-2375(-)
MRRWTRLGPHFSESPVFPPCPAHRWAWLAPKALCTLYLRHRPAQRKRRLAQPAAAVLAMQMTVRAQRRSRQCPIAFRMQERIYRACLRLPFLPQSATMPTRCTIRRRGDCSSASCPCWLTHRGHCFAPNLRGARRCELGAAGPQECSLLVTTSRRWIRLHGGELYPATARPARPALYNMVLRRWTAAQPWRAARVRWMQFASMVKVASRNKTPRARPRYRSRTRSFCNNS